MSKRKIIFIVFLAFIAVFSFFGWQSLKYILSGETLSYSASWILSLIAFLILGALFSLLVFLFDNLLFLLCAFGVASCVFLLIFGINPIYLIGLALGLGFMVLVSWRVVREKKFRIKIIYAEFSKPVLSAFFTVLILIISLALYFSPPAQNLSIEIKIPRSLFDLVLNSMTGILSGQFNQQSILGFNLPGLSSMGLEGLDEGLVGQSISLDEILDQEKKEKLYQTANQQLNFFLRSYKRYLPYGFAVAIFFTLIALRFIFVWLSVPLVQGIFALMKKMGLVSIKKEMVEREIIEI